MKRCLFHQVWVAQFTLYALHNGLCVTQQPSLIIKRLHRSDSLNSSEGRELKQIGTENSLLEQMHPVRPSRLLCRSMSSRVRSPSPEASSSADPQMLPGYQLCKLL